MDTKSDERRAMSELTPFALLFAEKPEKPRFPVGMSPSAPTATYTGTPDNPDDTNDD